MSLEKRYIFLSSEFTVPIPGFLKIYLRVIDEA